MQTDAACSGLANLVRVRVRVRVRVSVRIRVTVRVRAGKPRTYMGLQPRSRRVAASMAWVAASTA
eukprot:scaffold119450_cov33-Phaeocystis_antarctica.AAC.1